MALPSPTQLDLSPLLLVTVVVLGMLILRLRRDAVSRLGERAGQGSRRPDVGDPRNADGDPSRGDGWRTSSAWVGLGLLAIAYFSPLATLSGHYLLTAHLVQVTLVMGFAPPLLLMGLPSTLPRVPRTAATAGRVLVHPACAVVLVNLVFFGWHAPVLFDAALLHPSLYALQQLTLLAVSLAFWWAIIEPTGRGTWSMSGLLKLGYILLATIPQTFAGLLFALAHHTFYAPYAAAPRVTGLDALGDQQLAGALMAILSKLALFAAFSVILWRLLDENGAEDEQNDDGGHGGGDDHPQPIPPGTPAWLDLLRSGRTVPEPRPALTAAMRRTSGNASSEPTPVTTPAGMPAPTAPTAPDATPAAL